MCVVCLLVFVFLVFWGGGGGGGASSRSQQQQQQQVVFGSNVPFVCTVQKGMKIRFYILFDSIRFDSISTPLSTPEIQVHTISSIALQLQYSTTSTSPLS